MSAYITWHNTKTPLVGSCWVFTEYTILFTYNYLGSMVMADQFADSGSGVCGVLLIKYGVQYCTISRDLMRCLGMSGDVENGIEQ